MNWKETQIAKTERKTRGNNHNRWVRNFLLAIKSFKLNSFSRIIHTIKIPVGNNINTENYELTPFIHWQDSLFVFTAIEANTSNTPDLITIDLNSKTIKLNLTTILSVQTTYNLVFKAEVVPFPSPDHSDFPHNYIKGKMAKCNRCNRFSIFPIFKTDYTF